MSEKIVWWSTTLTWQFADKPNRGQSSRWLVNLPTTNVYETPRPKDYTVKYWKILQLTGNYIESDYMLQIFNQTFRQVDQSDCRRLRVALSANCPAIQVRMSAVGDRLVAVARPRVCMERWLTRSVIRLRNDLHFTRKGVQLCSLLIHSRSLEDSSEKLEVRSRLRPLMFGPTPNPM